MRKRVLFGLKDIFFVMFGGCPYFLSKALDKVYRLEKLEKVGQPYQINFEIISSMYRFYIK